MRISKIRQLTDDEFKNIIATSFSYSDCLRKIGLSTNGGSSVDILKERIRELKCDISHFQKQTQAAHDTTTIPLEKILVEHSTYKNTSCLKQRLIKAGLLKPVCAICGLPAEWNGQPLSLQLDHINGDNTDNRLENLRLLCPNCHSQTKTYAGHNKH